MKVRAMEGFQGLGFLGLIKASELLWVQGLGLFRSIGLNRGGIESQHRRFGA